MAIYTVTNILREAELGVVVYAVLVAVDHIRGAFVHAGEVFTPVNFVDHDFHIQGIGAVRVSVPRVVTGHAVLNFPAGATTVKGQWVVAVVTVGGGGDIHIEHIAPWRR